MALFLKDSKKWWVILFPQFTEFPSINNRTTMSPFIIFAIVLTIAYLLYYAAIITMDLVQKPKDDDKHAESIPIGGENDNNADAEPAPRTVRENPLTGGFDFGECAQQPEEVPSETEPEEAQEVKEGIPEPPVPTPSTNEAPAEQDVPKESQPEEAPAPPKAEEAENFAEEETEIADPHITSVDFLTKSPKKEPSNKPFDESKAFNQNKILPQYGVSETYDEKKDDAVERRAYEATRNLKDNKTSILGGLKTKSQISHELQTNSTQTNIEHKDVCTQC